MSDSLHAASGRLEFRGVLDGGAFGKVWRAFDAKLGREVAVKIVRESLAEESSALDHARALARVRETAHVVVVYDVVSVPDPEGSGAPVPAVVTELIDGCTLEDRLARPLDRGEARRIGLGIVAGVGAIHAVGLAHADLHCRNVMVTAAGEAKVIDILYRDTLAALPTARRQHHLRRDVSDAAGMLGMLLHHAGAGFPAIEEFRRAARTGAALGDLGRSFEAALDAPTPERSEAGRRDLPMGLLGRGGAARCRRRILRDLHAGLMESSTGWWRVAPEDGDSADDVAREAEWLRDRGWVEAQIAGDASRVDARLTPAGRDIAETAGLVDTPGRTPVSPPTVLAVGSKAMIRYRAGDGQAEIMAGTIRGMEGDVVLVQLAGGADVPVDLSARLGAPVPYTDDTEAALRVVQWEREGYRVHLAVERGWGVYLRAYRAPG